MVNVRDVEEGGSETVWPRSLRPSDLSQTPFPAAWNENFFHASGMVMDFDQS